MSNEYHIKAPKPAPTEGLRIQLGIWAPPLKEQMRGLRIPAKDVAKFQEMDRSISLLRIHSILTVGESDKARHRLVKEIMDARPKKARK